MVARSWSAGGRSAVAGALVDALAAAHEGAPLGAAGGRSAFQTDSEAASSPTGTASHTWVTTRSQRNWRAVTSVPGGPNPRCRATYCQKCWGTKMCRRRASSGPVTASTSAIQARLARVKRHQCQRRWSKITACPTSQATMDSGENQTSSTMTSSRPLAAGWRAARGWADRGWRANRGPAQGGGWERVTSTSRAQVAGPGHLGQRVDLDGMAGRMRELAGE